MAYYPIYQLSLVHGLLEAQLDPQHELLVLARQIDWEGLEQTLRPYYKQGGRPAKPTRLLVGLHLLKHRYDQSDAEVVQGLSENLYWMVFCGVEGELGNTNWLKQLDASTMTKFRQRIGVEGIAKIEDLLREHLPIRRKTQIVDTTVQPKNVAYPRDTHLLERGRSHIVKLIRQLNQHGIFTPIRSYAQKAKAALLQIVKLGQQAPEQVVAGTKALIACTQNVLNQVPEVLECAQILTQGSTTTVVSRLAGQLQHYQTVLTQVVAQTQARLNGKHLPNKILSLHEPQVVALAKRKRGRNYEYGSKVSLSMDSQGYIVGHQEYDSALADLQTLEPAIQQWQQACGRLPAELGADRGYHSTKPSPLVQVIPKVAIPTKGKTPHRDHKKAYFRRLHRKRTAIEPVIGHLKSDHRMDRCRYKGFSGDQINVAWAVMSWNLKKWAKHLQQQQI